MTRRAYTCRSNSDWRSAPRPPRRGRQPGRSERSRRTYASRSPAGAARKTSYHALHHSRRQRTRAHAEGYLYSSPLRTGAGGHVVTDCRPPLVSVNDEALRHHKSVVLMVIPSMVSTARNRGTFGKRPPPPPAPSKNAGKS